MQLLSSPSIGQRMDYQYHNRQAAATTLWVALPLRRAGQEAVRIALTAGRPDAAWLAEVNGAMTEIALPHLDAACNSPSSETVNVVVRYHVPAGETVAFIALVRTRAVRLVDDAMVSRLVDRGWTPAERVERLSDTARAYFTRASRLVHVDDSVRAEAQRIVGAEAEARTMPDDPGDAVIAGRLAACLRSGAYQYQWPATAAGSAAMHHTRAGDCASFALLFVSWCRSLGIPARAVVGSWARGTMEGHVWSEVFVRGVGWTPLDPSMGALVRQEGGAFARQLDAPDGFDPHDPVSFDSGVERGRVAFSTDVEAHALPGFVAWSSPPREVTTLPMADAQLRWGFELLDDRVPYLQPAYPRFGVAAPATSDDALLGSWSFRTTPVVRGANWLASFALATTVLSTIALLAGTPWLSATEAGQAAIGSMALFMVARLVSAGPSIERCGAALLLSAAVAARCAQ